MKTFEERFTAWADGQLFGDELAAFEKELLNRENAMAERADVVKLGALLREHGAPPALKNEEFFNLSLMEQIDAERPTSPMSPSEPAEQHTWWGLPRIVWFGAACLVASMILLPFIVPDARDRQAAVPDIEIRGRTQAPASAEIDTGEAYVAEVIEATAGDPGVSAVALHSDDKSMTVVWLDGLDYIPASNQITASNRAN